MIVFGFVRSLTLNQELELNVMISSRLGLVIKTNHKRGIFFRFGLERFLFIDKFPTILLSK